MGRPKGSKNKPKTAPPKVKAKAKAKAREPAKAEPPDWLRKAMAVKPTKPKVGRKPNAVKEKFQAKAKAKRGKMANISKDKPLADPLNDPDLGHGVKPKGDIFPADPKLGKPHPDQSLPVPGLGPDGKPKGTPVVTEREEEPAPKYDEVQSGAEIPPANAEMLIAGTLGGSGDHHADARRILERFVQAEWVISKALDAGSGDTKPGDSGPGGAYRPGQLPWQKPVLPDTKPIDPDKPQLPSKPGEGIDVKPEGFDPKGADAGKGRSKDDPKGADDGKRS